MKIPNSKKTEEINKLINKKISFYQIDNIFSAKEAAEIRRKAIEKITGVKFSSVGKFTFDSEVVSRKNCENLIGGVQIPLGIAGPLKILGKYSKGDYFIPLATTEGALVASVNRGCKAINLSGGVKTEVENIGMTRAPVFKINPKSKIQNTKQFVNFIDDNFGNITGICEETSRHLKLLDIEPFFYKEEAVFLRFRFDTGLAMGMNMVTIAVNKACQFIEVVTGAKLVALSSNLCVDKKASLINFNKGRGKRVKAEIVLSPITLKEVLKTTAKDFFEVYRLKICVGSKLAGIIGQNGHTANIIAAIFAACGQDLAHVSEAAIGATYCEKYKDDSLKLTVILPDLPIGVIGGGTGISTQKECLSMMGVSQRVLPGGTVGNLKTDCLKFAEIIGGVVLAGEISLIAALASRDLAKAHERLGRSK